MEKIEITERVRKVIHDAERDDALAIAAIDVVEKALKKEFQLTVQFGDEQTFRVVPTADAKNKDNTVDEDRVKHEFIEPASNFSATSGKGHEDRSRPIITKFHADNERQKYEAVTNVGSAKQVARWIIMFRELARLKATDYEGVEGVSFRGAHRIDFESPFDGQPRQFLNTNGFHTNFSVLFDDRNMMRDTNFLMHAVHGVKTLSEQTTLLTAMHADDYARYNIPGSHKSNYVGVTEKKGDRSLRIVSVGAFEYDKKRVEDRMASSSTNPYYAHLKILLGVYLGLKDKVRLADDEHKPKLDIDHADYGYLRDDDKPKEKSILMELLRTFFTKPRERAAANTDHLHPIPKDIGAAMEEFQAGTILRDTLNTLNATYGDGTPIGDKLHEQVLQRVQENLKEQPAQAR